MRTRTWSTRCSSTPLLSRYGLGDSRDLAVQVTDRVGAGNPVTLCDLGIFVDQAAKPVPAQNSGVCAQGRYIRTSSGRALL
jgi:hypothetical protein